MRFLERQSPPIKHRGIDYRIASIITNSNDSIRNRGCGCGCGGGGCGCGGCGCLIACHHCIS